MDGVCNTYGGRRDVYRVLVGKRVGKKPLRMPRRRWGDNIKTDVQEAGCGGMDWTELAHDRGRWRTLVNAVMNLRFPSNAGNFLSCWRSVSFSRRTVLRGVWSISSVSYFFLWRIEFYAIFWRYINYTIYWVLNSVIRWNSRSLILLDSTEYTLWFL